MGQGDDDYASLFSSPLWITDGVGVDARWGSSFISSSTNGHSSAGSSTTSGEDGDDHAEINKTFLDTETLCSLSSVPNATSHRTPVHSRTHVTPSTTATGEGQPFDHQTSTITIATTSTTTSETFVSFSTSTGTGTGTGGPPLQEQQDLPGLDTFLLSRQTSAATMAFSSPGTAVVEPASNAHLPPSFSQHLVPSQLSRQEPEFGTLFPVSLGQERFEEQRTQKPKQHHDLELFDDLDCDLLFPDTFLSQPFRLDHRPSSSRSHIRYSPYGNRSGSNASNYQRVSSDGQSPPLSNLSSISMTKEEFEALPSTIQRKYFSTLERLRFVSPDSIEAIIPRNTSQDHTWSRPSTSVKPPRRSREHKSGVASSCSNSPKQSRTRITSTDQRFYANLPEKIKRRQLTEEEQRLANFHQQSVILDAADEALIKATKRPSEGIIESPLLSPGLSEGQTSASSMHSHQENTAPRKSDSDRPNSFYDSFRWLEEDDDLDLRLYLDDYHINLREEIPQPSKSRRPSFRRHMSINKLPFGRASVSCSRPGTMETTTPPLFTSPPQSPVVGSGNYNHGHKKSRTLSLITANRQPVVTTIDPAAAHYQDPEARMKLRVYLASPQKFDEAIEFGFPSLDGIHPNDQKAFQPLAESCPDKLQNSDKLRTFLADDQSSIDSDGASLADPESPKTPELFGKPSPELPSRLSSERTMSKGQYMHAPASSREMTLRMTLTRPDLRSSEEQIYGWKHSASGRGTDSRDEPTAAPVIYARVGNSKDSIEKQLAAMDHWNEAPATTETGVVKRFWNRMRRS